MTLLQRDRENIELGREEGREEGSNQMASLIKILLSENRTDELNRALEDPDFRNRLFEEYDFITADILLTGEVYTCPAFVYR